MQSQLVFQLMTDFSRLPANYAEPESAQQNDGGSRCTKCNNYNFEVMNFNSSS